MSRVLWPSAQGSPGCGPRGFASDVRPLPERTKMFLPSEENCAAVGYQPAGMNPLTRLASGSLTSTTATSLLSALATRRVRPSGESPSPLGVEPAGASG